ncbi:MAG TPA: GMC family oxidoreductase N-terminal domain-containing protein, partial [Acidimicrobiales bacterium]|nr:GMC family oxidoreductase N-terminal domain-containing protein [Acidimicrobiales bacterium]
MSQDQPAQMSGILSHRGRFPLPGIVGVCAALLPPEFGGPDPKSLGRMVEGYASRLPAPARHGFRGAVGVVAACGAGRLASMSADSRQACLQRLSSGGGSPAIDAVKAIVLLVSGADAYSEDIRSRSNLEAAARPDAVMDVSASSEWPSVTYCDAIVIGSGAGGAMAARTLSRSGMKVVVVEEGRRYSVSEFRSAHPLDRWASLYRDAGATAALGYPPVVLPIGRGVGGTTLVNSGTCYRPPTKAMLAWRNEAGFELADPDLLNPYVDDVWETLQVGPVPDSIMGLNGQTAMAGARSLGWANGPINRNAPGCGGCCQCAIGCPRNAKFGVHLNALPQACEAGAKICSEARVQRITMEGGRATGILAHRPNGTRFEIRASVVIVAAGATETPPLLRRSGLGQHHELGRHLAIHPAIGIAGRFEEKITPWRGVLQSASVEEFHETDGILIEATSTPPGMGSMVLAGTGKQLVDEIANSDHLCSLGAMIGDEGSGRVIG